MYLITNCNRTKKKISIQYFLNFTLTGRQSMYHSQHRLKMNDTNRSVVEKIRLQSDSYISLKSCEKWTSIKHTICWEFCIFSGVLLKKFLSDWTSKAEGTIKPTSRKAFLYGGHDATIVNILRALKVWDKQFPTYAITILFELSKDQTTNDYGLEVNWLFNINPN